MITMDNGLETKKIGDFNIICEMGHINPSTPVFSHKTTKIPGKVGLLNYGTEIDEKPFSFPSILVKSDWNETQRLLNKFVAFLFDDFGNPKQIKIIFDYEPDKYYMVECSSQISPTRLMNAARFNLDFVAYDPYKYSNVYADEITWGSEKVTFEYSYLLGREGLSGAITITNTQNVAVDINGLAVKPIFEITGSATNLIITANNEKINVGTFANTTWVIDTETFTSEKNGVETMLDMNHFWLLPGKQSINFSGANLNFTVRIKYRDKYQ